MRSISLVCLIFLFSSITANADVVSGGQPYIVDLSGIHMLLFAGPPANTPFVPKLPDTGQTTSYTATFGEDSDYTINPPSHADNGDGTVTDNNTGLMWQQVDDDVSYNWHQATGTEDSTYNPGGATDICGSLTTGGYNDWRLPSWMELMTLVDYGVYYPAIDTVYFPGTESSFYWSATSSVQDSWDAWGVEFYGGVLSTHDWSIATGYVRCVRGGQFQGSNFTDNGNGTVTDSVTGLTWQQQDDDTIRNWEQAISYCEGLSLVGESDWRLPNIKELQTIIDQSTYNPTINTTYFPGTNESYYWSSTSYTSRSSHSWRIHFNLGYLNSSSKSYSYYVRCVRGGQ